ncbi:MAG: MFS transporter [Firmicutes bacterium]|nr:MFS transporter [Bacillota bacterium]
MHFKMAHLGHIQIKHEARHHTHEQPKHSNDPLWTRDFFAIAIINLFVLSSGNMLIPTFPFYLKELGGSEFIVGLAASLYSIASMVMRPVTGWILDHKGRKGIFYIGVIGIILVTLGYNFMATIPALILFRVLHGFMTSTANTSCSTNACDIVPRSRFAEGMGMFGLTNSMAMAIAPAMGQVVMEKMGFHLLFCCCTLLGIISLFCLTRLKTKVELKPMPRRAGSIPLKNRLTSIFHKDALPASLVLFLAVIPAGAISSFVALFAAEENMGVGAYYFLMQAVGTGTARLFSGQLADRKGEGPIIYLSSGLYIVSLILIVFGRIPFMLYVSALLSGWSLGLILPAVQTMAVRIVPKEERGAASSTFLCSYDIGWALGGLLGGVFVTALGYRAMFAVLGVGVFASLALYHFWARNTRSAFRNLPENAK